MCSKYTGIIFKKIVGIIFFSRSIPQIAGYEYIYIYNILHT